jgi:hypothetical protein
METALENVPPIATSPQLAVDGRRVGQVLTSTRLSPVLKRILKSRSVTLVAPRRCCHVAALLELGF